METHTSINPYKIIIGLMVTMVMLVYLLSAVYLWGSGRKEVTITCKDFQTQPEAQRLYNSNVIKYSNLNHRNRSGVRDNLACTNLPKS